MDYVLISPTKTHSLNQWTTRDKHTIIGQLKQQLELNTVELTVNQPNGTQLNQIQEPNCQLEL